MKSPYLDQNPVHTFAPPPSKKTSSRWKWSTMPLFATAKKMAVISTKTPTSASTMYRSLKTNSPPFVLQYPLCNNLEKCLFFSNLALPSIKLLTALLWVTKVKNSPNSFNLKLPFLPVATNTYLHYSKAFKLKNACGLCTRVFSNSKQSLEK